ncbi:hypothetical protein ARMSODRAFT_476276 [Armillaria solidipes]|uniref:Uncharacterized protein n=1 Tax=Armillaria solidipes TaxID=1076256 RepID=A0A2H3B5Q7_9AGAR|nr:hypothetical protein ARMSODRAFT_476276 [Armillaria solidipes]
MCSFSPADFMSKASRTAPATVHVMGGPPEQFQVHVHLSERSKPLVGDQDQRRLRQSRDWNGQVGRSKTGSDGAAASQATILGFGLVDRMAGSVVDMVFVHVLAEALTVGRTFMPKIYRTTQKFYLIMLIRGTNLQMKFQANRVHFFHVRKKYEDSSLDTSVQEPVAIRARYFCHNC